MKPSLDIIVVNWNSGDHLGRCMQSVQSACKDGLELQQIVVVDNASSDRSAEGIEVTGLPLRLISNASNRGFAAACNQGARDSSAEYLLFLNPDVRLLSDSLQAPIQFMQDPNNAGIGICGIRLLDDQGHLTRTCSRFPTPALFFSWMIGLDRFFPKRFVSPPLPEADLNESRTVDQVMGAFFMVRRAVFEALGGFDERFFVYFEDLDFSYRAMQDGWVSFYLASAQAHHVGGGCSEQVKAKRLYYSLTSRILYCYKHFGRLSGAALLLATVLIEPVSRLALAVGHGSPVEASDTLKSYAMFWRELPSLIAHGIGACEASGSVPSAGAE
jgi:GT2 family glycosyltransferase